MDAAHMLLLLAALSLLQLNNGAFNYFHNQHSRILSRAIDNSDCYSRFQEWGDEYFHSLWPKMTTLHHVLKVQEEKVKYRI